MTWQIRPLVRACFTNNSFGLAYGGVEHCARLEARFLLL
jgi:hypothetical protein